MLLSIWSAYVFSFSKVYAIASGANCAMDLGIKAKTCLNSTLARRAIGGDATMSCIR